VVHARDQITLRVQQIGDERVFPMADAVTGAEHRHSAASLGGAFVRARRKIQLNGDRTCALLVGEVDGSAARGLRRCGVGGAGAKREHKRVMGQSVQGSLQRTMVGLFN
jgi:hypothetical protein